MTRRNEIENDIWFAEQRESINRISLNREVDVTDAVMQRIAKLQPMAVSANKWRHIGIKAASIVAAACVVIGFVFIFSTPGNAAIAPTNSAVLVSGIDEVYSYFDGEEADYSVFDDPITSLI